MDNTYDKLEHNLWDAAWSGNPEPIREAIRNERFHISAQYYYRNGRHSRPTSFSGFDRWMIHTGDLEGSTLLHIACFRGHVSLVEYLLSEGIDLRTRNNLGRTAMEMMDIELNACTPDQKQQIIELLRTLP